MSRQRPWRKDHPDVVIVARPSRWGNPYRIGEDGKTRAAVTKLYRDWLTGPTIGARLTRGEAKAKLAGRDLACWCPLDEPCHADVLLEIANEEG
ncbi:MAG: DUF4326 domain-containing protein [Rhodobacteraceae bacterium]|nr:DUF4326 domain-containing protein [Paracoccaceae bacterium]